MISESGRRKVIDQKTDALFAAIATAMRRDQCIAVIKAPPGSGKTHLLLRLVEKAVGSRLRVAVAGQTNAQVDDICNRIARHHAKTPVTRFAAQGMTRPELEPAVGWAERLDQIPPGPRVVVGTAAKWGLIDIAEPFDILFVDEAWQLSWADFMLCGSVSDRFVLIGDPGQIPPVVSIPVDRWETSPRAPHRAAPDVILADPTVNVVAGDLPACRRLPADAVDLVRPFYDFAFETWADPSDRSLQLKSGRGKDEIDGVLRSLAGRSVAAITLPTPTGGPPLELDAEIAHLAAAVAERCLARKAAAADDDSGVSAPLRAEDIGIAATHRIVNGAIADSLPARLRNLIRVDTPERWQGLERKVMIVVHPLSGVVHPSAFDLETGRLCVMASRHRSALIIVSRDHLTRTLETHIPSAEQAVGRPDVTGRGHDQHWRFWSSVAAVQSAAVA